MNASRKKTMLVTNVIYWAVAILLHPLAQLIPTSDDSAPRFFSLAIPIFMLLLAAGSTMLLNKGIQASTE